MNAETDLASVSTGTRKQQIRKRTSLYLSWLAHYRWLILILLAHMPLLFVHFSNLWVRPQYQHFPLILAAFVGLFANRVSPRVISDTSKYEQATWPILALWLASLTALVIATFFFSPWFAAFGFVIAVAGCIVALRQKLHVESAFGLWLICAILVPVPGNYQARLSQALQQSTTQTSGVMLDALGIPNLVDGTILSLAGGTLFVDEACSGIVSMMSILATCLVLAVIRKRSVIHLVLLVASGFLWAAAMNIVRITSIGFCREKLQVDLSVGWEHTAIGLLVYGGALTMIVSTDYLLNFLLDPGEHEGNLNHHWSVILWTQITQFGSPVPLVGPAERCTDDLPKFKGTKNSEKAANPPPFVHRPIVAAFSLTFCVLGLSGLARGIARLEPGTVGEVVWRSPLTQTLTADSLPTSIGNLTQIGFETTRKDWLFAQESRLWHYTDNDTKAIFSIDFAFPQWHDLCQCYEGIGWRRNGVPQFKALNKSSYVAADFRKRDMENGQLYFCICDTSGIALPPPETLTVFKQLQQRTQHNQTLLQIQLWVTRQRKATELEREQDELCFIELRNRLLKFIANESLTLK